MPTGEVTLRYEMLLVIAASTASCGKDPKDKPDAAGADFGESQIGVGIDHDPAWVTELGGPRNDQGEGLAVAGADVFLSGDTTSAWFGPFADPCVATGNHEGDDCADAFLVNATTGVGVQFGDAQSDSIKALAIANGALHVGSRRS